MRETETPDPFQLIGATIEGKYRVTSAVGDGGFGVVYKAKHLGFDEPVAVKCLKLPSKIADRDRDNLLEQLRDEGRLLLRLSRATSGIVQALDVGAFTTAEGVWVPFLVLEWLEGETLAQYLRARAERGEGPMSVADAVKLLEPAARALATAHAQKVAHRDVKPQNLFLAQVGSSRTTKVLDFGIAKVLSDHPTFTQALAATKLGPTAFTPRYGAPEQFNKKRGATGPWTDVFALALIVVEMGSGRQALDGDDPTELYIASADPAIRPTLRARGMKAPELVERVLAKALSVEAKHRYADAGEFWDALSSAVIEAGASALEVTSGDGPRGATTAQTMLSTAEFAAEQKLDVSTDPGGASKGQTEVAPNLQPTVPMTRRDVEAKEPSKALAPTVPASPIGASERTRDATTSEAQTREAATKLPKTIRRDDEAKGEAASATNGATNEATRDATTERKDAAKTAAKTALEEAKTIAQPAADEADAKTLAKPADPEPDAKTLAKPADPEPAAKTNKREVDPMSETPLPERAPSFAGSKKAPLPPEPAAQAADPAPSAAKTPSAAKSSRDAAKGAGAPGKSAPAKETEAITAKSGAKPAPFSSATESKPLPWIAIGGGALALAALGGIFFAMNNGDEKPAKPAASSGQPANSLGLSSSAATKASAKPAASASAPAISSAQAPAAPVVPPDDMVYIPPATFRMGEGDGAREVTLSQGFFIEKNEVTVYAYQACMSRRMCSAADHVVIPNEQEDAGIEGLSSSKDFADTWSSHCNEPRKALDNPINCVDYSNAESYCRWKGRRLPTEAEWELAARGKEGRVFPWGDDKPDCNRACYDRNSACLARGGEGVNTCPAGSRAGDKTPEGALDFGGNVSEWVSDGFASVLAGGADPKGDAASPTRVVRGGNLLEEGAKLTATTRASAFPSTAHVSIGFRCALDIGPPPIVAPAPPTSASAKSGPAPSASAKASPPARGGK